MTTPDINAADLMREQIRKLVQKLRNAEYRNGNIDAGEHSDKKYAEVADAANAAMAALMTAIESALAAPIPRDPVVWQPIATAPSLKKVLIHYSNELGKGRTIKARYVPRFALEQDGEDCDCAEYDEATDRYTLMEGWYEQIDNWPDYTEVAVSYEPTHWMPLPSPPAMRDQGADHAD